MKTWNNPGLLVVVAVTSLAWPLKVAAEGAPERAGIHGMAVVGEKTVYVSHLPMFMAPHGYQLILQVTFAQEGTASPQEVYAQDRRSHPEEPLYTLEPKEKFVLTALASEDPKQRRASFKADLYRGHFERGGTPILHGVTVRVEKVVFFKRLDPGAQPRPALEYLLFGDGAEQFLAHVITRPPDFDQLLTAPLADGAAARPRLITFPGRPNTIPKKLGAGEKATGTLGVVVGKELYFETGDLAGAQ